MAVPITIIGAGITGLATAYHLTEAWPKRYSVTIIARDLPGDLGTGWASPWACAIFQPQPTTNITHQKMQSTSFKFYYELARSKSPSETGVQIYPATEYYDTLSQTSSSADLSNSWIREVIPDFRIIPKSELPGGGVTSGVKYTSLAINPQIFLLWLKERLEEKGVLFIRQEVASVEEARRRCGGEGIVVNASGLGARTLASDESVESIRGQTLFIKHPYSQLAIREGSEYTYIIPRPSSGGVILGGVKGKGSSSTNVSLETRVDILRRVNLMSSGAFGDVDLDGKDVIDLVGFRPGRAEGVRVEIDEGERVVHAYGLGGAGFIFSFGVAERVGVLIGELEGR